VARSISDLKTRAQPDSRASASAEIAAAAFVRAIPTALLVGVAWSLAWALTGSVDAADWLPFAIGAGVLLAAVLLSGAAVRPTQAAAAGLVALVALAGWAALSLTWSAVPSLARDEALLTALYAITLAVPLVTLREPEERHAALLAVVAGAGLLAVAAAVALRFGARPLERYDSGRLNFPISYQNAQAAAFLVAFWPAVALAARVRGAVAGRAAALGAAVAVLGGGLLTQSKGAALGLAVSALFFFAVCPVRLRALVPAVVAAALVGSSFTVLTAPYRADTHSAEAAAIRSAGTRTLWLVAAAVAIGIVYALVDRRLAVPERARRIAGALVVAAVLAGAAAGAGAFFVAVDHPIGFFHAKWRSFKHLPTHERASTHLLSLGSNRYDFWRVAAHEFRRHPLAGIGARGFGPAYLKERRSNESPARAHSLPLETASEQGVVGLLLLVSALGLPLAAGLRRVGGAARAGALAGAVYWIAHASVDWTWTFPAAAIPFFLVLGIAAAETEAPRLRPLLARSAAAVAVLVSVLAFAPPWLSARFTNGSYDASPPAAARDLRWARRLDPLSVEPLIARATLARSPRRAIPPLERAVELEPRVPDLRYLLGLGYLRAGRVADARRSLVEAKRLDPRDKTIDAALRAARRRR
jgi:O-antigen ligase